MRILIVDNQRRARQSMKALLRVWYPNGELYEAGDGCDAVQQVEKFQPDVILMDARMPKMSGLEAVRYIRGKTPSIKIIILSMYIDLKAESLAAGAEAFVSKSDPPEILRRILRDIMGSM